MKKLAVIIGIIAIVGGIIAMIIANASPDETDSILWPSGGISTTQAMDHDWDLINIKGGKAKHTFTFTNNSNESLVIKTAETSCMCTTANISVSGENRVGRFGMHNNNLNWNKVVAPGDDFSVEVEFDPLFHGPDATGPIQRSIYLYTSAAADGDITTENTKTGEGSILEVQVSGNVLSKDDYAASIEAKANSADDILAEFEFADEEYDFGVVKQSQGIITHDFDFIYNGEETIEVTGVPGSCACTTASIKPEVLRTGDQGILSVDFDPNLHEEPEGKFFKTISVLTDPTLEETPEVKIWVEMDLDLGPEAYKLQEEHIN